MADWLDVSSIVPRISYTATASQTAFTVSFVFFEDEDLLVYQNTVLKTLATHYTVTGAEVSTGGTVTLLTGATAGDIITIVRDVAIEQTTHIPPSGPLDVAAMNFQTSKLIAIEQQLDDRIDRSLHFPDSDPTASGALASQAARANKILGFDGTGAVIYTTGPTFVGATTTGVAIVDSRATAALTTFAVSVNVVRTEGLAAPGDGGGDEYVRGLVGNPGAFQDGSGVYWKFATKPTVANLTVKSNISGGVAAPSDNTLTSILDAAIGSTRGTIMYRGASVWSPLTPGTVSQVLTTSGAGTDPAWAAVPASYLTPEMYGAVGDGVTNDTVALQNFLIAVAGKTGVFTSGKTYMFAGAAGGLFVRANTYLIGYGATLKALVTATLNQSSLNITDLTQGTAPGPSGVTIVGLTMNGNATARRAGGAFSGVGNAASFYAIGTTKLHIRDCVSINSEGDGFYIGGSTGTTGQSVQFSFDNCYATTSSRNGYSIVGATNGAFKNCMAENISYGASVSNISYGWDFEPDSPTSTNNDVHCVSCRAVNCTTTGFGINQTGGSNTNINWTSCYTQLCGVGYYSSAAGSGVRLIGNRWLSNTTNYTNCAEAIASFP